MSPERWARITEIFEAALAKPPSERPGFLDEVCASDEPLRREVERLLAQPQESWLKSPLRAASVEELRPGQVLGRYRVEAKLGEGGKWRRRRWLWLATAFVAIGATAGLGWWWIANTRPPPMPILRQITRDSGLTTDPAPSPDGKLLAFASDRGGAGDLDIWLQRLAGGEARRLTGNPTDDYEPCFSPDGTKIAFRSERDGGGIYVMSALGGDARLLVPRGRRPVYSPDGTQIAFFKDPYYFVAPAEGGEPWQISDILGADSRLSPVETTGLAWAPDGTRLIIYGLDLQQPTRSERIDWWVVAAAPRSSGSAAAVRTKAMAALNAYGLGSAAMPLIWLDDRIVFTAALEGTANIWQVPFSARSFQVTGAPRRLTSGTEHESQAGIIGGTRLVFATNPSSVGLWELAVDANRGKAAGEPRRLTTGVSDYWFPALSGDGSKLVFITDTLGSPDVWLRELASGREMPLVTGSAREDHPVISRDGSMVIYTLGRRELYSIPATGGVPRKLAEVSEFPTDWSKDRSKVLVLTYSPRQTPFPKTQISLLDLATGQKAEILKHPEYGIFRSHFSPDQRWLAFHVQNPLTAATREFVAPFRGAQAIPESEWLPVTEEAEFTDAPCWSPDGNLIYYVSDRDGFRCIWARPLDPAAKKPVGDPFAVKHLHHRRLSLRDVAPGELDLTVATGRLVFTAAERRGNIFIADFGRSRP